MVATHLPYGDKTKLPITDVIKLLGQTLFLRLGVIVRWQVSNGHGSSKSAGN